MHIVYIDIVISDFEIIVELLGCRTIGSLEYISDYM